MNINNFTDYMSFLYNFNSQLPTQSELNHIKYEIKNEIGDIAKMINNVFQIIDIINDINDTINDLIDTNNQNINDYEYDELNNYSYIFSNMIRNMYDIIPPIIPKVVYEPYIIVI
jgi:hypothetical protein